MKYVRALVIAFIALALLAMWAGNPITDSGGLGLAHTRVHDPSAPVAGLPSLRMTPRIYIDEKDTPGLANADRLLVLSIVLDNRGTTDETFVPCPMLHVHDPAEPDEAEQVLIITSTGGQRVDVSGPPRSHGRTMRFPFPDPTPFTISAGSEVVVKYPAKLKDFIPTLENFTRDEIRDKIFQHALTSAATLYIDFFFNFGFSPRLNFNFQCPHGPNTTWLLGIDPPGDFSFDFDWYSFTFTKVSVDKTFTVPLTTHTSETARALLDGTPISAFIEVTPHCTLVECPSAPGGGGTTGLPLVDWSTDPAPGAVFVIDEIEEVGSLTIDAPPGLPEGAVIHFQVVMKEAGSGRVLSGETQRFAQDTAPPLITDFDFTTDGTGNLEASATVQDQAASIEFVELLVSRDGGSSFAGFPMEWQEGDFLNPTLYQTVFGPLKPGETIFKIRAVDEGGNTSETPPHSVEVPLDIDIKPGSDPNSINSQSRGLIPVAILSTSAFDAPSEVDKTSLTFGRTGDEGSLAKCPKSAEDVNGDGLLDQVCHFKAELAGLQSDDTEGILRGVTVGGVPIEGSDSVRIVPPSLDSDGDGFADVVEATLTTDQFAACSLDASHDAWPADISNDGISDITDIVALSSSFGQAVPAVPVRHDMASEPDGFVDISDIVAMAAFFGQRCAGS